MKLSDYLKSQGRGAFAALARDSGSHVQEVSNWCHGIRPVPPNRCIDIELATNGAVTRRDLRPTDWFLLWPADDPLVLNPQDAAELQSAMQHLREVLSRQHARIEMLEKQVLSLKTRSRMDIEQSVSQAPFLSANFLESIQSPRK